MRFTSPLLLALAPSGCAVPLRSLDPERAIPEQERFELFGQHGYEVYTAPTVRREPRYLEATFVARRTPSARDEVRLTEFSVVTWIDADGDGRRGPAERARLDGVVEPGGTTGAVLQVVTPFEPGLPVRFELRTTLGGETVLRAGELAY